MGILDNIRNRLNRSNNTPVVQEDSYRKSMLAEQIVNLVGKIKRINSFDSSIWNLSNVTENMLQRKSQNELENIYNTLSVRLLELTKQSQKINSAKEDLEATKWTGQMSNNMNAHDLDRFQRDDER